MWPSDATDLGQQYLGYWLVAFKITTSPRGHWIEINFLASFIGIDHSLASGGRLNKKDGLTRYGNSHVKDKTS